MTTRACAAVRQALFQAGGSGATDVGIAIHLATCDTCRAWQMKFAAGSRAAGHDDTFTAAVLARTAPDSWGAEVELLWARDLLPDFAEVDPGPGFTARVLAATSGARAKTVSSFAWPQSRWNALVRRPRFALEAAYVLTIILMLVAGNPLAAIGPAVARAPIARQIGVPVDAFHAGVRVVSRRVADVGAVSGADAVVAWPAWLRDTRRWVAGAVSAWLTRLSDAASSAAGWIRRHLGERPDETTRSS